MVECGAEQPHGVALTSEGRKRLHAGRQDRPRVDEAAAVDGDGHGAEVEVEQHRHDGAARERRLQLRVRRRQGNRLLRGGPVARPLVPATVEPPILGAVAPAPAAGRSVRHAQEHAWPRGPVPARSAAARSAAPPLDAERDGVHAERELHGGECRRPAVAPSAHELAAVTPLMECCPFLPPLRVRSLERAVLWRPLPRRRGERHHSARRAAHDLELEAVKVAPRDCGRRAEHITNQHAAQAAGEPLHEGAAASAVVAVPRRRGRRGGNASRRP
mmetsp:Transcript_20634/g.66442  ORF Transcript_20634/g.66442 Transcript_20634/m.66442 type:complete len:273 (-) Transcript_20634:170-988(-)